MACVLSALNAAVHKRRGKREHPPCRRRLRDDDVDASGPWLQVFDVSNGANALALPQSHTIDVLVTDIAMQEMDGMTLANSLLKEIPDLPIVCTSGYSMKQEVERR